MRPKSRSISHTISLCALIFTGALTATAAAPALADPAAANTQTINYTPDDFKNFQCSTALDIVSHVPGFVFSTGNTVRGFADAAGNVLIDGQRPASKVGLDVQLNNIAVSQIDRIEVITGGAPGIDMQGYQQIVNIIRKSSAQAHQSIDVYDKVFTDGPNKPAIEYSFNQNNNGRSLDVDLQLFEFRDNGVDNEQRYDYYPGQATPAHTYLNQLAGGSGSQAKVDYSQPFFGGKLSFNGFYNPIYYTNRIIYSGATQAYEHYNLNEFVSEWGVQYERPLTKTVTVDINVLQHYDRQNTVDVYTDATGPSANDQLYQPIEHIISAKLTWQPNDKMTYKIGGESTFNRLDNSTLYTQDNQAQSLPFSTITVEEHRAQVFVTGNWQALPKLAVEVALKVETSTISVPQSNRAQSFVYPKPEIQLVWSPTNKLKLSWRSERIIGQLNFTDFASSVQLATSVVKSGNPNIVPQTEWAHTATIDYSFWDKGAISLALEHEDLQNTLDEVALVTPDGIDNADGNIGKGRRDSAHLILDLPTDRFLIKNGELKIDYTVRSTDVTDPITGVERDITNQNPWVYTVTFQQRLNPIHSSWGLEIDSTNHYQQFNAQEYYYYKSQDWFDLWFEYKAPKGMTYGVYWDNPLGRHDNYERQEWQGLRGESPLAVTEYNVALERPWINFHIKKEW